MAEVAAPGSALSAVGRVAWGLGVAARHAVRLFGLPERMVRRIVRRRRGAKDEPYEAAEIAAAEGLSALSRALSDPDPAARLLALDVICEFSEERASRLVAAMLCDRDARVREAAAAAAARIGASGVVFSLILSLDDESEPVRTAAAKSIREITGREVRLDGAPGSDAARARVIELKKWWKQQRLNALAEAALSEAPHE